MFKETFRQKKRK